MKRLDLVYAPSGVGKTTWWLGLAIDLFERTGLKTRCYIGDGGGETITVSGVEDFVEVCNYALWNEPFSVSQAACDGWWPQEPENPASKWMPPGVGLGQTYGLFVFEGLTVMSDYMMGDRQGGLANRMSQGQSLNKDESFRIEEKGEVLASKIPHKPAFGGNARTHYMLVQRRILDLVQRSAALPGITYWTAHERIGSEDPNLGGGKLIGPDVCGEALTSRIGASFGNTIHLMAVSQRSKVKDPLTGREVDRFSLERRAYTRRHMDPEGRHMTPYYANTRLPLRVATTNPNAMPEWMPADPVEYYKLVSSLRGTPGAVAPSTP
jgi:hypothetical protein